MNLDSSIAKSIQNDRVAQKQLYDYYKHDMFVLCKRYFNTTSDAEDALQDGFIKLFKELSQYESSRGTFKAWMSKVFVNICLEKLRKKNVFIQDYDEKALNLSCEHSVLSDLNLKEIVEMISNLPPGYRTIFNLNIIEGYTHQEISNMLNISINTSKTQLMKAKNLLKRKIELIFL